MLTNLDLCTHKAVYVQKSRTFAEVFTNNYDKCENHYSLFRFY